MRFFVGLDLGQASDYTALAIMEKTVPTRDVVQRWRDPDDGREQQRTVQQALPAVYHCRRLERARGVPYPKLVERVVETLALPPLPGQATVVVDYTGVGRPVFDMLRAAGVRPLVAVTIHGGDKVTVENGYRVPKRDLVGVVSVLLSSGRLKIAEELPHTPTLMRELENFRVKIDPVTAHDSYSAWREGQHDDLVLSCAIALWHAERWRPPVRTPLSTSYPTY